MKLLLIPFLFFSIHFCSAQDDPNTPYNDVQYNLLKKGKKLPNTKVYNNTIEEFKMVATETTDVFKLYDLEDDTYIGLAGIILSILLIVLPEKSPVKVDHKFLDYKSIIYFQLHKTKQSIIYLNYYRSPEKKSTSGVHVSRYIVHLPSMCPWRYSKGSSLGNFPVVYSGLTRKLL